LVYSTIVSIGRFLPRVRVDTDRGVLETSPHPRRAGGD